MGEEGAEGVRVVISVGFLLEETAGLLATADGISWLGSAKEAEGMEIGVDPEEAEVVSSCEILDTEEGGREAGALVGVWEGTAPHPTSTEHKQRTMARRFILQLSHRGFLHTHRNFQIAVAATKGIYHLLFGGRIF